MKYTTLTIKDTTVCGIKVELTRSQNLNARIIKDHWKMFNRQLQISGVDLGANWKKFGLTTNDNGRYFYMAAIPAIKGLYNFQDYTISARQFARFTHAGDLQLLKSTINNIYKSTIPISSLRIDKDRALIHYEYYDHRFNWNHRDSIVDILVPVEFQDVKRT